jgi:hypothetical protein
LLEEACEVKLVESEAQRRVNELLQDLREGRKPQDNSPDTASDTALDQLHYKDFPALRWICASLTVKSKDKKIDVLFRAQITGMIGVLNLYLDPELSYSWHEASLIAAKSQGHGPSHAQNLQTWIHRFLSRGVLPFHRYGQFRSSMLEDEDFAQSIQLHLQGIATEGYIPAQDIVNFLEQLEMQLKLEEAGVKKKKITLWTAQRWLHNMGWRYRRLKNGMYIDGHERPDIVDYQKKFIMCWKVYEKWMRTFDNEGEPENFSPHGFPVPAGQLFKLILVTHDESVFYENDRRKTYWSHVSQGGVPQRKGEGISLMVSDFLTTEWGRLTSGTEWVKKHYR